MAKRPASVQSRDPSRSRILLAEDDPNLGEVIRDLLEIKGYDVVLARDGEEITVSSRPSDAIALAARTGSPIFVAPQVLEESGVEMHDEEEEDEVARFRNFLDSVTPDDFESA